MPAVGAKREGERVGGAEGRAEDGVKVEVRDGVRADDRRAGGAPAKATLLAVMASDGGEKETERAKDGEVMKPSYGDVMDCCG